MAGGKGKKCCIVNLRTTYPPEEINGVMVCGTHFPDREADYTYPPELKDEIGAFHQDNREFQENNRRISEGDETAVDRLLELVRYRVKVFRDLLKRDDYDLGFFWMHHTDTMQHFSWNRPELILRFYRGVDALLSEFVSEFKDANLLVVSDHGHCEPVTHFFHPNAWLRREGYLSLRGPFPRRFVNGTLLPVLMRTLPKRVLNSLLGLRRSLRGKKPKSSEGDKNDVVLPVRRSRVHGADWSRIRAFCDLGFGIRLHNVAGEEYESLREELITGLLELRHDGRPVIYGAWKREEIYTGKYLEQIPDVVMTPSNRYYIRFTAQRDMFSPLKTPPFGNHISSREGILVAVGPDIRRNHHLPDMDIYDVTPLALFMMGLDVPRELDGKVRKELFEDSSPLASREIRYSEESTARDSEIADFSEDEEREMREHLRSLGYVD
jgi:predicted AlkP superfamily phosphohydrolase/phosphomutase